MPLENRTPPITLRDVARAAGVSTASASRALARQGAVSADLQRRILAAASRLGYTPNLAARALAGRRSGLVGVLVNHWADPLIGAALTEFEQRLAEAGYGVMVATSEESLGPSLEAVRRLVGHGAEAIVLAEPAHGYELGQAMRARAVPSVVIGEFAGSAAPAIALGRRRGAALAARYLLELGHRRIGVVAPAAAGTAEGVTDALAGSHASTCQGGTLPSLQDLDAAQSAIRLLLENEEAPTAFVCASDLLALAAVREGLRRGVAVPGGLSVVGFGDAELARRASPALTTVRLMAADFGLRLAQSVLDGLERGIAIKAFELPIKLVVRESTGVASR